MSPISASFGGASRRGFGMLGGVKIPPLPPTSVTQLQPGATGTITTSLYIPEAGNTLLILYLNGVSSNSTSITGYAQPGTIQIGWGVADGTQYTVQYKLRKNGLDSALSTAVTMYSGPSQIIFSPNPPYFVSQGASGSYVNLMFYADGISRYEIQRNGVPIYNSGGIIGYGQYSYQDYSFTWNTTESYSIKRSVGNATQQTWYSTPSVYTVVIPVLPPVWNLTFIQNSGSTHYIDVQPSGTQTGTWQLYCDDLQEDSNGDLQLTNTAGFNKSQGQYQSVFNINPNQEGGPWPYGRSQYEVTGTINGQSVTSYFGNYYYVYKTVSP